MKVVGGILAVCLILAGAVVLLSPAPAEARFRMDGDGYSYAYAWQHETGQQSETVTESTVSDQDQTPNVGPGLRGPYGLQDGTCDPEQPQDGDGFGFGATR